MSRSGSCQAEFKLSNFGLEFNEPSRFTRFEFGYPRLYLVWRGVMAAYHLIVIILTGFVDVDSWTRTRTDEVKWFVYLTNWMYLVLAGGAIVEFAVAIFINRYRPDILNGVSDKMPVCLKLVWVLQTLSNSMSLTVTVLYWGFVFRPGTNAPDNINIMEHGANSLYTLVNFFLVASPVRLYHFYHSFIVAVLYVIFTVIYFYAGGTNGLGQKAIYSIIDWSKPQETAAYCCSFAIVAPPAIQLLLWTFFKLRVQLYSLCVHSRHGALIDVDVK